MTALVIKRYGLSCQVCVPEDWTDAQAKELADAENPCDTERGWLMRKDGDPDLVGNPERVACAQLEGHVHIMFDA